MHNTYLEILAEDRRLVILRFLAEDADYSLNTSILRDALDSVGHRESRQVVEQDAAWLETAGLVTRESIGPVTIVKLTPDGLDVAQGRTIVPGVKRPGPR